MCTAVKTHFSFQSGSGNLVWRTESHLLHSELTSNSKNKLIFGNENNCRMVKLNLKPLKAVLPQNVHEHSWLPENCRFCGINRMIYRDWEVFRHASEFWHGMWSPPRRVFVARNKLPAFTLLFFLLFIMNVGIALCWEEVLHSQQCILVGFVVQFTWSCRMHTGCKTTNRSTKDLKKGLKKPFGPSWLIQLCNESD